MTSPRILVMGVAGSGKSTLARQLAEILGVPSIEGDDYHSANNKAKMSGGIALQDGDRLPWLDTLTGMLANCRRGAVLSCSALKRSYRDRVRKRVPDVTIVFLDIDSASASARVASRTAHIFPTNLVDSQFEALESPVDEPDVLRVDAQLPTSKQCDTVLAWLEQKLVSAR